MAIFVPCKKGYLYNIARFERADRRGDTVVASVDLPNDAVEVVEFPANSWDEAVIDQATTIPAQPGYYVLASSKGTDGAVRSVKIDVIAWRLAHGTAIPVTVHAVHRPEDEPYAVLCPDGHVEYSDGSVGPDVEDFLNGIRSN